MRRSYNPLIALVQTLDDGIEFYRIAEEKTQSSTLRSVFKRMAEEREFALAYIVPYISQHDYEVDKSHAHHGSLTNRFALLLDDIVTDEGLGLVKEVEEHLVDAMISASANTLDALVQLILKDLVPRISNNYEACVQEISGSGEQPAASEAAQPSCAEMPEPGPGDSSNPHSGGPTTATCNEAHQDCASKKNDAVTA
jgi:Domain of unknown function (DUF2383)